MTENFLSQPADTLRSIGEKKSKYLEKLGIYTIEDLLRHFPRDYEDRSVCEKIADLKDQSNALVFACIKTRVKGKYKARGKSTFRLLADDGTGMLEIVFFNMNFADRIFQNEESFFFYGKVTNNNGKKQMVHPDFVKASEGQDAKGAMGILPVYRLTKGISTQDMRKWMRYALPLLIHMKEVLPSSTVAQNRLCDGVYAIENIHFPQDFDALKIARFRLIFEEFFMLQTGLLLIKNRIRTASEGIVFKHDGAAQTFLKTLPYKLTGAQLKSIDEIIKDMCSAKIMNRLVQGDVGCGKTIVAAAAIYQCIQSGYQAVLMAPTEILARQHYEGLCQTYKNTAATIAAFDCGSGGEDDRHKTACFREVRVGFLSGSLSSAEKKSVLKGLAEGEIDLLIGTHAVIQPDVRFNRLGLVVTDEQHRFGVKQREMLSFKGDEPDMLVMTATPIPRTLALILYGDLDISLIDEMPPGRKEIITYATGSSKRKRAYDFADKEIKSGRQVYVVSALIEDSESEAMAKVRSAKSIYDDLTKYFPKYRISLIHGGMKQREKDGIMESFKDGIIEILVATSLIEVGINVPNASVMVIENAERFGLAQMHQLRGRVGRGEYQSYCLLISDEDSDIAKQRADIMKETSDGFVIAEKDLKLRGPGEFFGTRQHGVPELKIADPARHIKVLKAAQGEADRILKDDPLLEKPEHRQLLRRIEEMFDNAGKLNL